MANRIKIRHGNTGPTSANLLPYELGWDGNGYGLYINNNGTIEKVGGRGLFLPLTGGTIGLETDTVQRFIQIQSNTGRILLFSGTEYLGLYVQTDVAKTASIGGKAIISVTNDSNNTTAVYADTVRISSKLWVRSPSASNNKTIIDVTNDSNSTTALYIDSVATNVLSVTGNINLYQNINNVSTNIMTIFSKANNYQSGIYSRGYYNQDGTNFTSSPTWIIERDYTGSIKYYGRVTRIRTGVVDIAERASGTTSINITFATAYNDTPIVLATLTSTQTQYIYNCNVTIKNISSTGFTININNGYSGTRDLGVQWLTYLP